jgi:hypothetical protein
MMMSTIAPPDRCTSWFKLEKADFRYEPFPIGVARPVFEPELYEQLLDGWPPQELFAFMPSLGKKYSLSEVNEPARYHEFVERSPIWKQLHREIKSASFVRSVVRLLAEQHIDLGIPEDVEVNPKQPQRRWFESMGRRTSAPSKGVRALKSRFEFSMLPADGGHIKPHTDSPGKIITLVASMVRPDEWNAAWGGGTTVLRAKDVRYSFNYVNRQLDFDAAEVIDAYAFEPNQCVLFVKTFNSLHAVSPLTGFGSPAMRKTLTINIEVA